MSSPATATDIIKTDTGNSEQPKRWRDVLPIHPAAELFPLMSAAELREFADDIKKQGLREPVDLYHDRETSETALLDGRNRFDALELLGEKVCEGNGHPIPGNYRWVGEDDPSFDPYAYVLSKNVHRRHLTAEQKRELIAKVLKAKPEQSNRTIAKQVKADDKTVAKVRTGLEATAEIPQLERTTGADGKARPIHRHTPVPVPSPPSEGKPTSRPSPSKLPTPDEVRSESDDEDNEVADPATVEDNALTR